MNRSEADMLREKYPNHIPLQQASEYLGVSPRQLSRLIAEGREPFAAIGANIGTSQKYIRIYTERLAEKGQVFAEADAWLDLWCHTVYRDMGNAFSFLAPAVQYGKYGSVLTLETLGQRWKWEKTKVWRFFQKFTFCYSLHKLPGSFGCVIFNTCYPTVDEFDAPGTEDVIRILELIRIQARNTHTAGTDNERLNRFVAWKSRRVLQAMEDTHNRETILKKTEESSDFRDRQEGRVAEIPPSSMMKYSIKMKCSALRRSSSKRANMDSPKGKYSCFVLE